MNPCKRAVLWVVMAAASGPFHATAAAQPAGNPTAGDIAGSTVHAGAARRGGIWKAAVPPTPMKGEFDNLDPLGVAAGARIKADC